MNKIEELEGKIAELSKELEKLMKEIEKEYEPNWAPKLGEYYWYIGNGSIFRDAWENNFFDKFRRDYLKIFKTESEAEEYFEYIKAKKEYSHEFTLEEWENKNIRAYCIYYDFDDKSLGVTSVRGMRFIRETYFKTIQDAKEFIDKYSKEIKKYDIGIKEV